MEMTWLETFELLGLDLLAVLLLALVALYIMEHALHRAWSTARECAVPRTKAPAARSRVRIGTVERA